MSQNMYHWEALRKQQVVDRKYAALKRLEEKKAEEEAARTEAAAREERERQERISARKAALQEQVKERDLTGIKKSYKQREEEIQRLLREKQWHNGMIDSMNQRERQQLKTDLIRDHKGKEKVLRDHGLYRGHPVFFSDPMYN
ncbi:uncharacterized protein [Amphiura filiformis]|uniref:uncharacterized protein n=1 Tax=Amphiura filiformis TaxID=82378 RepID=UPI003B2261AE